MKLLSMIRYDLYYGIIRRWGYFVLPVLLGIAGTIRGISGYSSQRDPGTLLDYCLLLVYGSKPYEPNPFQTYTLPVMWMILQAFCLIAVNNYMTSDLEEHGQIMIIRCKSRYCWWFSKCFWCIMSVLLFYGICFLSVVFVAQIKGIPMYLKLSNNLIETSLEEFLKWKDYDVLLMVMLLPLMMSVFLGLLQMLLGMLWNSSAAFLVLLVLQGISAYKQSELLWGNWGMPIRMLDFSVGYQGNICYSLIGAVVCICAGAIIFRKRDLLEIQQTD